MINVQLEAKKKKLEPVKGYTGSISPLNKLKYCIALLINNNSKLCLINRDHLVLISPTVPTLLFFNGALIWTKRKDDFAYVKRP